MTYVIAEPCVGVTNAACVEVCPAACIHPAATIDQYVIDPHGCIDCGVCAAACPVEAIFVAEEVPDEWQRFVQLNALLAQEASCRGGQPRLATTLDPAVGAARRRPDSSKGVSP